LEKCLKAAPDPTRQLHSVLGNRAPSKMLIEKDIATNMTNFHTQLDLWPPPERQIIESEL